MATQQLQLVYSNSSWANFSAWASAMSAWFATAGWVQANDTGQVVWTATVLTLTQVASSAGNSVYSYSSFTGPAPRVGMSVIITGFATGGNNVTATLTVVSGGASGTVTVVTSTQGNETHAGSGTTTANSSVPGTGAFVYEIWKPGDGGTAFYVRFEYGNAQTGTNVPGYKVNIGSGTDGAGTLTWSAGTAMTAVLNNTATTSPSAVTQYECNFAGGTNYICFMMWRNTGQSSAVPQICCIQRSLDSTGAVTNSYVTLWFAGQGTTSNFQQSYVFGVGASPRIDNSISTAGGMIVRGTPGTGGATSFNNAIPFDTASPIIGYYDYPCTVIGSIEAADITEGVTFTATLYSATRTYMPTKNLTNQPVKNGCYCMRYD